MNRHSRSAHLAGPSGLLLAALLALGSWSGCAEEDTVATIVDPDGSIGPFSDGDGGYSWQAEGELPSGLQDTPDGGSPDAGAGE